MDKLLTDQGDPEKPAGGDDATASRSFVATAAAPTTKQMMRYTSRFILAGIGLLGLLQGAVVLVGAIVGWPSAMQVGGGVIFFGFLLLGFPAYAAFQRRIYRDKKMLVEVGGDGLTVNTKPGAVFSFGAAQLGRWTPAGYGGMTKGTALHLRAGTDRFVLGGRDHRITSGTPLEAAPVDGVDAWVWAAEFDELLTSAGRWPIDGQAPEETRCLLVPNSMRSISSSFFGMFKNTATALRLNANPPQPSIAIDVDKDAVSLIDLKSNSPTASAPVAQVTATAALSTRSMPYVGTQTTPVLVVRVPDAQPLTIGCPDVTGPPQIMWNGRSRLNYRFSWRGTVPREQEPAFVVSDMDWLTLVEKFGLATQLEDKAAAERDEAGTTPAVASATARRPRTKLWILAIVATFLMIPIMWMPAIIVMDRHQQHAEQLVADRERPFALPFTGLRLPHGVAVDGAGDVYVAETRTNQVIKLAAGSNTQTVLPFTGLDLFHGGVNDDSIAGVAVDAAGNVYVSDPGHNRVVKLAAGSNTQTTLPFSGLGNPLGVAVDTAGAVYVIDDRHGRVLKLAAGSSAQTVLPPLGNRVYAGDVAVDTTGNVYISVSRCGKSCSGYLLKLAPGSDTWVKLPPTGRQQKYVAVDTAGNLYAIVSGGGVVRLAPGSKNWTEVPGGHRFVDPLGLTVDTRGNVYVTDHTGSRQQGGGAMLPNWPPDNSHGFVLKFPTG